MKNEIVLFESEDGEVKLDVELVENTIWFTEGQMAALFGMGKAEIARLIFDVYEEGEAVREATCVRIARAQAEGGAGALCEEEVFSLDVAISVAYRAKSKRGVEFRRWAAGVLRQYMLDGYAANERRLAQLGKMA